MNNYPKDIIDGVEVPPLVIREDYDLLGLLLQPLSAAVAVLNIP